MVLWLRWRWLFRTELSFCTFRFILEDIGSSLLVIYIYLVIPCLSFGYWYAFPDLHFCGHTHKHCLFSYTLICFVFDDPQNRTAGSEQTFMEEKSATNVSYGSYLSCFLHFSSIKRYQRTLTSTRSIILDVCETGRIKRRKTCSIIPAILRNNFFMTDQLLLKVC